MESSTSSSRTRMSEIPKPESGLAEWTSKIKAMQRQVDADDEAEQKRLEEEIAASRLARLRRGHVGNRANTLDPQSSSPLAKESGATPATPTPVAKGQTSGADSMHKFKGDTSTPNASATSPPIVQDALPSSPFSAHSPIQKKSEPMSLAAFMGGRATGPRLNKHAPQQDAHDPTQFEQRLHVTSPHPVFGKGGVAMPGMDSKGKPSISKQIALQGVERPEAPSMSSARISGESERQRNSLASRRYPAETEQRPVSPQKTGSRERTTSMPSGGSFSARDAAHSRTKNSVAKPDIHDRPVSRPSVPGGRSKTPTYAQDNSRTSSISPPSVSKAPSHQLPSSISSPPKSPVTPTSLARPIRPEPRPSPEAPQISHSSNPSPAFLRPSVQKDPTPSISRLQGRGFVQNMVKVSAQLESPTPSPSGMSEKSRASSGRTVSVLDRWQPTVSPSSTATTPPVSPKSTPIRKSRSVGGVSMAETSPQSVKPVDLSKSLNTALPMPQVDITSPSKKPEPLKGRGLSTKMPPEGSPGLGSANTLLAYTTKTGDTSSLEVDELGVRSAGDIVHKTAPSLTSELPTPSGKPLIHPTKDRARKPRKERESSSKPSSAVLQTKPSGSLVIPIATMPRPTTPPTSYSSNDKFLASIPPLAPASSEDKSSTNVTRIVDEWADHPVISVRPVLSAPASAQIQSKSNGMVGRRALPGLVPAGQDQKESNAESTGLALRPRLPGLVPTVPPPPDSAQQGQKTPPTPGRHTRIPSTGNRATVMDVAQVLSDQLHPSPSIEAKSQTQLLSRPEPNVVQNTMNASESFTPAVVARPKVTTPPTSQAEKRKSNYEKYSAIILPPLKEETTPAPTPTGSLLRSADQTYLGDPDNDIPGSELPHDSLTQAEYNNRMSPQQKSSADMNIVHYRHIDEPLPRVDIDRLVKTRSRLVSSDVDIQTISVDVMIVTGTTAVAVSRELNIFYDTEVLAIIHRSKSKSSGLVATTVWEWQGKKCLLGEREQRKLQDLAKRYGTSIITVKQHSEPAELVSTLGGRLAVRQGIRAHWTSENTTMHLVRSLHGVVYIDEHDFGIKNLCSGFSYCLSILGNLYVWYGCGSTAQERQAALEYANCLETTGASIVELAEGENDNDEMFWMVLGDDQYAKADYWKWRRTAAFVEPDVWRIDTSNSRNPIFPVKSFLEEKDLPSSTFIMDCVWELFVLVGREARGKRRDIRLAVSVAMELCERVAMSRPYSPTIHVLVLPTQLPLDLRLNFRDLDEALLNDNNIPDHMNILSCEEALQHLHKSSWEKSALSDHTMLPLGVDSLSVQ